jgi:uncharacterized OB-fold protein
MTDASAYDKPLPTLDDGNRPFWDGARAGHLVLQHCDGCGKARYPINHVCPHCLSGACTWKAVSGRGTVWSTIVFHQVYNQAYAHDVPYNVALIQLEEGPRMISNVVGVAPSDVKVGDKVRAVFDAVTPDVSIPRFERIA